nr:RDD family protein [Hymenobacter sp. UV11]
MRDTEEYVARRPIKSVTAGPRFGHFIVDMFIFQIIIYVIEFLSALFIELTHFNVSLNLTIELISNVLILALFPGLYLICERLWQKTPGKFLTKTVVIDEYGNKPTWQLLILRSVIRLVPFDAFSCLGDTYSHGWHDSWSKTWVVPEEERVMLKKLQKEQS